MENRRHNAHEQQQDQQGVEEEESPSSNAATLSHEPPPPPQAGGDDDDDDAESKQQGDGDSNSNLRRRRSAPAPPMPPRSRRSPTLFHMLSIVPDIASFIAATNFDACRALGRLRCVDTGFDVFRIQGLWYVCMYACSLSAAKQFANSPPSVPRVDGKLLPLPTHTLCRCAWVATQASSRSSGREAVGRLREYVARCRIPGT